MNPLNSSELKSIIGEMPNWIFEYLELSEDIKEEWKHGSKASDFGGHKQFVKVFSERLEAVIAKHTQEARIDELESFYTAVPEASSDWIDQRIAALKSKTGDK